LEPFEFLVVTYSGRFVLIRVCFVVPPAFSAALRRRESLRADGATDALRLIDGTGDGAGFAGLILEEYAGRWLVQTDDRFLQSPPAWLREIAPAPPSIYWKRLDKENRQSPVFWHGERIEAPFAIREHGVRYQIDFSAGYSQGIFLDQRENRRRVLELARADARTVLNLFSYTCAFSIAAASGGALTASVDLSRRYLDWGRENFRLNQLDPAAHEFYAGDAFDWLRRLAKKQRRFDLVIVDPPTFSRDRAGKIFRVERDYARLAAMCAALVEAGGRIFCSTNHRGLAPGGLGRLLEASLGSNWHLESVPMPEDFPGEPYLQAIWARRID
jgi:23S rRNA (cytosine1962-C5)-methyltransferase